MLRSPSPLARPKRSVRGRGVAAPTTIRDIAFRLDYATWHAHLAGRPLATVSAPVASGHDIVFVDYATWHAHLAGLDKAA